MAEADELLGGEMNSEVRSSLYRESGGNPFYLEQLGGAARRGDGVSPATREGTGGGLPPAVGAAIRAEIEALASLERTVLQAAAVLGELFAPELVAATADVPESALVETLDDLLLADL